jgi:hypothetical protein
MRPWPRPERPEKRDIGYGLSKAVDSGPPAKSQSLTWLKSPEPGMTAFAAQSGRPPKAFARHGRA